MGSGRLIPGPRSCSGQRSWFSAHLQHPGPVQHRRHRERPPGTSWAAPARTARRTEPSSWKPRGAGRAPPPPWLKEGTGPQKMPRGEPRIAASAAAPRVWEALAAAGAAPASVPAGAGCQPRAGARAVPQLSSLPSRAGRVKYRVPLQGLDDSHTPPEAEPSSGRVLREFIPCSPSVPADNYKFPIQAGSQCR